MRRDHLRGHQECPHGKCVTPPLLLPSHCLCIPCVSERSPRVVRTESHNKDNALFKACQARFGNSIPRSACLLFVKHCPVCIGQVNIKKKKVAGFQPIITKGFGKRGQVCDTQRVTWSKGSATGSN